MKKIYSCSLYSLMVITLGCLATLSSCSKKSDPNPQDQVKFTWSVSSVTQDGVDLTADYAGMTMAFDASGTYTTVNAHKLFHTSGAWKWEQGSASLIHIDPTAQDALGIPVQINFTEGGHTLTMTFPMDITHVNANGRVEATVGNYVVVMKR